MIREEFQKCPLSKVVRKLMLTSLSREPYVMQQHTKIRRGPHDHWREYGALMKIYSIGGWKIIKKCHDKKSTQYQFVRSDQHLLILQIVGQSLPSKNIFS
uniref:Uncharacterized protein n=1 Tax=Ditylenchus dipsaci TaxID=166011 RepID=A0A915DAG5_9BILA